MSDDYLTTAARDIPAVHIQTFALWLATNAEYLGLEPENRGETGGQLALDSFIKTFLPRFDFPSMRATSERLFDQIIEHVGLGNERQVDYDLGVLAPPVRPSAPRAVA